MKKLFKYDGPITKYGNLIASLVLLNFLTLLCCIPVFTAGAAVTAMHYVTYRIVCDEEPSITKTFFKAFRQSFKKATELWLICLIVLLILAVDFQVLSSDIARDLHGLKTALIAAAIIVVWIIVWALILASRYEDSLKHTLKNAAMMIPTYPVKSLIILASLLVPFAMCFVSYIFLVFAIAFGFTISAYIQAKVYRRIFANIEKRCIDP